jgi:hypothetical protein
MPFVEVATFSAALIADSASRVGLTATVVITDLLAVPVVPPVAGSIPNGRDTQACHLAVRADALDAVPAGQRSRNLALDRSPVPDSNRRPLPYVDREDEQ